MATKEEEKKEKKVELPKNITSSTFLEYVLGEKYIPPINFKTTKDGNFFSL